MPIKEKLNEKEAAAQFVLYVMTESKSGWLSIRGFFEEVYADKDLDLNSSKWPDFELGLAVIAVELISLKNLLSPEQFDRIHKLIWSFIEPADVIEYSKITVAKYQEKYMDIADSGFANPVESIAAGLCGRWFRSDLQKFAQTAGAKKTGIISPILLETVAGLIQGIAGNYWAKINNDYVLIP